MTLLIAGVALWFIMHSFHPAMPGVRKGVMAKTGENGWKGLVSLGLLASIVLIVIGWRSIEPSAVYTPPEIGKTLMVPLMFISIVLFGAANMPSNIKQFIRHPMLMGMALWGIAHLIGNGDDRSIVLFGGMAVWALLMQPFINKRDGAWEKPEPVAGSAYIKLLVIGLVIYLVFAFAHPWIAGVPAIAAGG